MFEGKIHLDGKLVETIMPYKDIEAFENCLESIDEHYDEGSVIVQEADFFMETDQKVFNKIKGSDYAKGTKNVDKMVVRYQGRNCYIPDE